MNMAIYVIINANYAILIIEPSSQNSMKIGLLVFPGCMPAGLFAAADIFQAVNRRMGKPVFEPLWIGAGNERVNLSGGPALVMDYSLQEPCDAYLIPGFWAETATDIDRMLDRQTLFIDWLRQAPKETALWAYCMGVALVAAAGRIDHCEATATWWLEQSLRKRFAAVEWNFQQPVIENRQAITAAGANGYWAVLSKLLITRIPAEVIRDVEQALMVPRANTGHPVFRSVEMIGQTEPQLQRLIAYAQTVPASDLSLNAAAKYLFMSSRTLSRKIDQATQISAGEWLRLIKLHQVANALLSSTASVKTICAEMGFTDEASLMRTFKKMTGMTTSQYRQQYGHSVTSFVASLK
jgi:transcriptional regulator GlxA family with amidase domain